MQHTTLLMTIQEFVKESLGLFLHSVLPVSHQAVLLLPDLNGFFEFHLALQGSKRRKITYHDY
ncbi:hypothetical protein E2C01_079299 [Portunus trituberculatus]|uniref:Uncharacterized protein n=1 Tax=Portunus trituberculatus TaxID=210409 RepID=A0A5B7IV79_PORTR|nr:hypothetical protein [Portunus trituberculatus]